MSLLLTVDQAARPDISDVVRLPVFRDALLQMKKSIKANVFVAVRDTLNADIDAFLQ